MIKRKYITCIMLVILCAGCSAVFGVMLNDISTDNTSIKPVIGNSLSTEALNDGVFTGVTTLSETTASSKVSMTFIRNTDAIYPEEALMNETHSEDKMIVASTESINSITSIEEGKINQPVYEGIIKEAAINLSFTEGTRPNETFMEGGVSFTSTETSYIRATDAATNNGKVNAQTSGDAKSIEVTDNAKLTGSKTTAAFIAAISADTKKHMTNYSDAEIILTTEATISLSAQETTSHLGSTEGNIIVLSTEAANDSIINQKTEGKSSVTSIEVTDLVTTTVSEANVHVTFTEDRTSVIDKISHNGTSTNVSMVYATSSEITLNLLPTEETIISGTSSNETDAVTSTKDQESIESMIYETSEGTTLAITAEQLGGEQRTKNGTYLSESDKSNDFIYQANHSSRANISYSHSITTDHMNKYAKYDGDGYITECMFDRNHCLPFSWSRVQGDLNHVSDLKAYAFVKNLNISTLELFEAYYPQQFASFLLRAHEEWFFAKLDKQEFDWRKTPDLICQFIGYKLPIQWSIFVHPCDSFTTFRYVSNRYASPISLSSSKLEGLMSAYSNYLRINIPLGSDRRSFPRMNGLLYWYPKISMQQNTTSGCPYSSKDLLINNQSALYNALFNIARKEIQSQISATECSLMLANVPDINNVTVALRWIKNHGILTRQIIEFWVNQTLPCLKNGTNKAEAVLAEIVCSSRFKCVDALISTSIGEDEYLDQFSDAIDSLLVMLSEELSSLITHAVFEACIHNTSGIPAFPTNALNNIFLQIDDGATIPKLNASDGLALVANHTNQIIGLQAWRADKKTVDLLLKSVVVLSFGLAYRDNCRRDAMKALARNPTNKPIDIENALSRIDSDCS